MFEFADTESSPDTILTEAMIANYVADIEDWEQHEKDEFFTAPRLKSHTHINKQPVFLLGKVADWFADFLESHPTHAPAHMAAKRLLDDWCMVDYKNGDFKRFVRTVTQIELTRMRQTLEDAAAEGLHPLGAESNA